MTTRISDDRCAGAEWWAGWRRRERPAIDLVGEWWGAGEAEPHDECLATRLEVDRLRAVIVSVPRKRRDGTRAAMSPGGP